MKPIILFRPSYDNQDELEVAHKYFRVETSRSNCRDEMVIGRYSTLPFYGELQADLAYNNCILKNSYPEHCYISKFQYYEDIKPYTFETWNQREFPRSNYPGPFVVKGITNSKKHNWNTQMYAADRRAAVEVASRLSQDMMLRDQEIIYRKYEPLKTFEVGLNGLPFTNEYRFFFWKETPLASAYYWSEARNVDWPTPTKAIDFALKVARIAAKHTTFFVIDVGEKALGGWILIELNCGTMSGLSMINPEQLYGNLVKVFE